MSMNPVVLLSDEIVRNLLHEIAPGSTLRAFSLLPGSFSNSTHVVEARAQDGTELKFVVRRYAIYGDYDRGEKARREYKTIEHVYRSGIPTAEPLYLDESGSLLGTPGIVTRFVQGSLQLAAPAPALEWARELALRLAQIHAVRCDDALRGLLLEANVEATWFLDAERPPKYMQAYPGGAQVWQSMKELSPNLRGAPAGLVHIDYWPGNVLWQGERISAVLDWEEAAYGDPAIDVAYARMNLALLGLDQAMEAFLGTYEAEMGRSTQNLGFWELAAAVRPISDPEAWKMTETGGLDEGRLRQFIAQAEKRLGA